MPVREGHDGHDGAGVTVGSVERDVLRIDGRVVRIRNVRDGDRDALIALNTMSSDQSIYLRFSSGNRKIADLYVDQILRPRSAVHEAIVAVVGEEIVGVAGFEGLTEDAAEVALLVADSHHHEGLGTLLLEHLATIARERGYRQFDAEVLLQNRPMLKTFRDLGYERVFETEEGLTHVVIQLEHTPQSVAVIDERDRVADAASMHAVLVPESIAVIGIDNDARDRGHAVLTSILAGGFRGPVMAVDPRHTSVAGIACVATAKDLPFAPDLAVVAVAPDHIVDVVRDCGERGVRAILLLTSGFGEVGPSGALLQDDVLEIVRGHGMRMVGPNCLGVVNTDPDVRLNATFAHLYIEPGPLAVASQSGVVGITTLAEARRRGLGIAQFVSMGNKADVSGNDLLNAWEKDPRCEVITLYLESLGNPRKFARLARRVAHTKPIIAIKAGRLPESDIGARTHTASAASTEAALQALFAQSGVVRVATVDQMLDAARVLSMQPLPAGRRVAIVGNAHGPVVLAADAATTAGLHIAALSEDIRAQLRSSAPGSTTVENPVDLGIRATPENFHDVVRILVGCDDVDAVLVIATELLAPHGGRILTSTGVASGRSTKPVIAVRVGDEGPPVIATSCATQSRMPVFDFPESAAEALARACDYVAIREAPDEVPADPKGVKHAAARAVVNRIDPATGGWLGSTDVAELLGCYGIGLVPQRIALNLDEALAAATELGYPVVLKQADFLAHVATPVENRLRLRDETEVRTAYAELTEDEQRPLIVQHQVRPGVEIIVGAVQDRQLGPLVMVGAGGVFADVVGDRAFRLAPVGPVSALAAIESLQIKRLFRGVGGRPPAATEPLVDLMVRIAALADDLPEVAELDLNPVICRGDEATVINAMIRIAAPSTRIDPYLRALRRPR